MLHHPIYAGAYSHGRQRIDPRRKVPGRRSTGRTTVPMEEWDVLRKDDLPAYITWDRYLANQERLEQNRARWLSEALALRHIMSRHYYGDGISLNYAGYQFLNP